MKIYKTYSESDTENFAYKFAKCLKKDSIIVLTGNLGTGKTRFMKGIARYFGIENDVSSPTFTIVNEYTLPKEINKISNIYHFDVYRIQDSMDFVDSIGTDYFSNGLCILEWGENIKDILPENTIYIKIEKDVENENKRTISINRGDNK